LLKEIKTLPGAAYLFQEHHAYFVGFSLKKGGISIKGDNNKNTDKYVRQSNTCEE
jgi:hypothetical protein